MSTLGLRRTSAVPLPPSRKADVCIVGAGWLFTSGISYYTCRLANAMADESSTSVILMRSLLPRRFYPGAGRVGAARATLQYRDDVDVFDGVDWHWGRSLLRALAFLVRRRPETVVFQWWTATVLHTYLTLAVVARLCGAHLIVEFHEVQDTGEVRLPFVGAYARLGLRSLLRLADGCLLHSEYDRAQLSAHYGLSGLRQEIAPHGPYDHYSGDAAGSEEFAGARAAVSAPRTPGVTNILFFGTIRPYKGLEDLVAAFDALEADEVAGYRLTIVGETWEGWTLPLVQAAQSRHATRITIVNDYVPDDVVGAAFAHADLVVLPYHRSSSSGPLHVAMSCGLPVVLARVGGLVEAAADYPGCVFVDPADPGALLAGIRAAGPLVGQRFTDIADWGRTIAALRALAGGERGCGT